MFNDKKMISCLCRVLPLLLLCQCAQKREPMEYRALRAMEQSNNRELDSKTIEEKKLIEKHLLRIMKQYHFKRSEDIDYPSDYQDKYELYAIYLFNKSIRKFSEKDYERKLEELEILDQIRG